MAASITTFQAAVERVLNSWTVLKLAVEHGFGGADSRTKAEWMVFAIDQWFKENADLDPSEVEDFLGDILNNEFDTVADDGSLPEMARLLCGFYKLCRAGNEPAILAELQKLPNAAVQNCVQSSETQQEVDEDGDLMDPEPPPVDGASQHQTQEKSSTNTDAAMETDEDGWNVVRRVKKK